MLLSVQPAPMTNDYSFSKQTQKQENRESPGEQWEQDVEQQRRQHDILRQQNQPSQVYPAYQDFQESREYRQPQEELTQQSRLPIEAYPRDYLGKPQGGYAVSTHQYLPPIQQSSRYLFSVPNHNGYVFQQIPADEPKYSSDYNYQVPSLQPSPQQQALPLPTPSAPSIMSQYPPFPSLVNDAQRRDQLYANPQYYPAYNGAYLTHPSMSPIQSRSQSIQLNPTEALAPQQYYGQKIMVPLPEESYGFQQQQQQQQIHMQQLQQLQLQQQQLQQQQQQLQEAHHKRKYKLWSEEEDQRLLDLKRNKLLSWKDIATRFSDRTLHACQFRWRKISPYLDGEDDVGNDGAEEVSEVEEHPAKDEQAQEVGEGDGDGDGVDEKNGDGNIKDDIPLPSRTSDLEDEPTGKTEHERSSSLGKEGDGSNSSNSSARLISRPDSGPREMKIRNILN